MYESFETYSPRRSYWKAPETAIKEIQYVDIELHPSEGHIFYTGFGDEVSGIFISTYHLKEIGTPVTVSITFPGGSRSSCSGVVEWIREQNPLVPDMEPGYGIKIQSMDHKAQKLIDAYLVSHGTLFFDSDDISHTLSPSSDPVEPEEPADDFTFPQPREGDENFYSGLLRDVQLYLDQNPNRVKSPGAKPAPTIDPSRVRPVSTATVLPVINVRANYLNAPTNAQFHGGFSANDDGPKIFVETDRAFPVGSQMRVCLDIPGNWRIKATGEVKWMRKSNPALSNVFAPPGVGVCLTDISPSVWRSAIQGIVNADNCLMCEEVHGDFRTP